MVNSVAFAPKISVLGANTNIGPVAQAQRPGTYGGTFSSDNMYEWLQKLFGKSTLPDTPKTTAPWDSPYAKDPSRANPTENEFFKPYYLSSLTPAEIKLLKDTYGKPLDNVSAEQLLEWLNHYLNAALLNPGGVSSAIEQIQALRAVIIKAATLQVQVETLAIRRLDLLYRKGVIKFEEYSIAVRAESVKLRDLRFQLESVSITYAQLNNAIGRALVNVEERRVETAIAGLQLQINSAIDSASKNLLALRTNAKTGGVNVEAQIQNMQYATFSILDKADTTRQAALAPANGTKPRALGIFPLMVGDTFLDDSQRSQLDKTLFPVTNGYTRNGRGSFQPNLALDVSGQSISPGTAVESTLAQQQRIKEAQGRLRQLSQTDLRELGGTLDELDRQIGETVRVRNTLSNGVTTNAIVNPNRAQTFTDYEKAFEDARKQVLASVDLDPKFRAQIKSLNNYQWRLLMVSMAAASTLSQGGKIGAAAGTLIPIPGVGTVSGYLAGKAVQTFMEQVAGEFGYVPQSPWLWMNALGTFMRSLNLEATVHQQLIAIETNKIQLEQLRVSQDLEKLASARSNLSEAEYNQLAREAQQKQQRLELELNSVRTNRDRYQVALVNLNVGKQAVAVNTAIADITNANADASAQQAITNLQIAQVSKEQAVFNNNLQIATSALTAYNGDAAKTIITYGAKLIAKTDVGLIIPQRLLSEAQIAISEKNRLQGDDGSTSPLSPQASNREVALDDPEVLALAARKTNAEFASLHPQAWGIVNANNGQNVVGRLAVRFVLTGQLGSAADYSPARWSNAGENKLPPNPRIANGTIVMRLDAESNPMLTPRQIRPGTIPGDGEGVQ